MCPPPPSLPPFLLLLLFHLHPAATLATLAPPCLPSALSPSSPAFSPSASFIRVSFSSVCILILQHLRLLLLALFSSAITAFLGSPSFLLSPFNPHRVRAFSNATVSMYTHTQCESLSSMYNAHTLICMSVHVGVRMRTCACALASMYVRV